MNIQTRKISFVQDFLKISNDQTIEKFEKLLKSERKKYIESEIKPMSVKDYEKRIQKSIDDVKNGRIRSAKSVKKEIASWK